MARPPVRARRATLDYVLDVCVHGNPISAQTNSRIRLSAWKRKVRETCLAAWPKDQAPIDTRVGVRVTFFREQEVSDIDNLVKPILDALQGIAYLNDRQVSDVIGRRRDIDGMYEVRYMSAPLAMAFSDGSQFVHIEVWRDPRQEVIV